MDPRTRTFSAIAELPNKDRALRSGLYAEVSLGGTGAAPSHVDNGKVKVAAKRPAPAKVSRD
jgi:hypothetical protein